MREVSEGDRITEQNNLIDELTGAKTMRAILINPKDQTMTEVEVNGDYKDIQRMIEAKCFDVVRLNKDDTIYVDDEGLINGVAQSVGMFRVDGKYPAYLAGKGLLLANNRAGESVATKMDIEELRKIVAFGVASVHTGKAVFYEAKRVNVPDETIYTGTGRHWDMDA
jgi:hypothetical protein